MKIIIINGPCGVGKSTIAAKLHESMPLSFLLNIDDQRRLFSHYKEKKEESKVASLKLAEAIIGSCLDMEIDIIVDKMLYDSQVLDSYYELAKQKGAQVVEIILWAPKEVVMERAGARGWKADGLLTPEKCEFFWHQIDEIKDKRPNAKIIDTSKNTPDDVHATITKLLTN